jgi:hypothetical protein
MDWIDALRDAHKHKNPEPLIALLLLAVPERVRPFIEDFMRKKLGPPGPGKPSYKYEATVKEMAYTFALPMVRELVDSGQTVKDASKQATVSFGPGFPLTAKALAKAYSASSGHGRKIRKRVLGR